MKKGTKIEWADFTDCFWWGCDKVSEACQFCYAENIAKMWGKRLFGAVPEWGKGKPRQQRLVAARKQLVEWNNKAHRFVQCMVCGLREFRTTGVSRVGLRCCSTPGCMALPETESFRVRPRIFINSMSDWLDEEVPIEWFAFLLESMWLCPNLDYLLLTKRPENWRQRILEAREHLLFQDGGAWKMASDWIAGNPPPNFWIGATLEKQNHERLKHLLNIPAAVRFLSCEPLLEDLGLKTTEYFTLKSATGRYPFNLPPEHRSSVLAGIHWVIAGGESGASARPSHPDWFRSLRDDCVANNVPFLFKQWGEWLPAGSDAEHLPNKAYRSQYIAGGVIPDHETGEPVRVKTLMLRPGKDLAGRLLDGREWNQFPTPSSKPAIGGNI